MGSYLWQWRQAAIQAIDSLTHSGYTEMPSPQSLRVLSLTRFTALVSTGITGGRACSEEEAAPTATGNLLRCPSSCARRTAPLRCTPAAPIGNQGCLSTRYSNGLHKDTCCRGTSEFYLLRCTSLLKVPLQQLRLPSARPVLNVYVSVLDHEPRHLHGTTPLQM
jgi:hypothetical protein